MSGPYFWINLAILLLVGLVLAIGFRSLPDSPKKQKLKKSLLVLSVLLLVSVVSQNIWPKAFGEASENPIKSNGI